MKGSVASSCFPVLVLVLQASLCLASRPQTERSLLAAGDVNPAGTECAGGELCSTGPSQTAACASAGGTCAFIPAGLPCRTNDLCSTGAEVQTGQVCPVDPDTKTGTCPVVAAGAPCQANDLCATSATTTAVCKATSTTDTSGTCPTLPLAASCTKLAGACTPLEACNAPAPVPFTSLNFAALFGQDFKVGACTLPKAAGARCTKGTDVCQGAADGSTSRICASTNCPLIRPGAVCNSDANAGPIDKCYDGTTPTGTACATNTAICPVVGSGLKCMAGDPCSGSQLCNAVGTSEGLCVTPNKNAGDSCAVKQADTAADICRVTVVDPATLVGTVIAQNCAASNCPQTPAGQSTPATSATTCSAGGPAGQAPTGGATPYACPAIGAGLSCNAGDTCSSGQFCNAKGAAVGKCMVPKAAGQTCGVDDVCGATGTLCPTSSVCPVVPAGAVCTVAGANRLADQCNNGNVNATLATTDCSGGRCPILTTGLVCTSSDVCVRGATCLQGLCQPNGKTFASSTTTTTATPAATSPASTSSTGKSTAATVPSVSATATLTNYDTGNFTTTVQTQYCNAIEANIQAEFGAVSSCSVGTIKAGSVVVPTTIALTGSDSSAATTVQGKLVTALKSSDTSVFGSGYGTVTVDASSVTPGTVSNPEVTSGAAVAGVAWTVAAAFMISALVMAV